MAMSVAGPPAPPPGWWIMKRVFGRQTRRSFGAARNTCVPALATQPVPTVVTGARTKRMTSWIASPDSTWPPGDEISMLIGASDSSASAISRVQVARATVCVISPNSMTKRDLKASRSAIASIRSAASGFSSFACMRTPVGWGPVGGVIRPRGAHGSGGALLAAGALWALGEPPLLLDMRAEHDFDHVVAIFKRNGCWGAISKTNGIGLRWRDPVYRSLRELAMSYFHEYYNGHAHKTLREYSVPYDLRRMDTSIWVSGTKNCWVVGEKLDEIRHFKLVNGHHLRAVTRRDPFERRIAVLGQYRKPRALVEKLARLKKKRRK